MNRRYKLLKDLPDCEAGRLIQYDDMAKEYFAVTHGGSKIYFQERTVEDNLLWFSPIEQPENKEAFTWTDELVAEACYAIGLSVENGKDIQKQIPPLVNKFKEINSQSKQSPQPKQERIRISNLQYYGNKKEGDTLFTYLFCLNIDNIPSEKYESIKQAIEQVLNDEAGDQLLLLKEANYEIKKLKNRITDCKYTDTDLYEAKLNAFNAARETKDGFYGYGMKYPTFTDYKNTLP